EWMSAMNRKVASIGWMRRPVWARAERSKVAATARPPSCARKARREVVAGERRFIVARLNMADHASSSLLPHRSMMPRLNRGAEKFRQSELFLGFPKNHLIALTVPAANAATTAA